MCWRRTLVEAIPQLVHSVAVRVGIHEHLGIDHFRYTELPLVACYFHIGTLLGC
jgi:hypothetical protein